MSLSSLLNRFTQRSQRLLFVLFLPLMALPPGQLTTVVGTGTAASCSEAVLKSAISLGGLITFNCGTTATTITLTDDIRVTRETIVDGKGLITINGNNVTRVFLVGDRIKFTAQNLTIINGKEPAPNGMGGGIYGGYRSTIIVKNSKFDGNDGTGGGERGGGAIAVKSGSTLSVDSSVFTNNKGILGGAINNLLSQLTVTNSTFTNNDSTAGASVPDGHGGYFGGGGAIYVDGASEYTGDTVGGAVRLERNTFSGNRAAGQGGAVYTFAYALDTVTVRTSTFANNSVVKNAGGHALGGGYRHGGNAKLIISDSTFNSNLARAQGGGLWTDGRHLAELTNVTFANNRAVENDATNMGGLGGAVGALYGNWRCTNCTIAGNLAGNMGGGIYVSSYNASGTTPITLINTLVVNNKANNNGSGSTSWQNCTKVLADGGYNMQYPARNAASTADTNCTATIKIADPKLSALANNGGPTQTMAVPLGSPAMDTANNATCPVKDQRATARPQGLNCDIGAFELVK